jgi:hypothetical protein
MKYLQRQGLLQPARAPMMGTRGVAMALDPEYTRILDNVLRALSTATRSLRLYPPTSPIPRETVDAAIAALADFFSHGKPDLKLTVAAAGFAYDGEPVATNIAVSIELANTLRDHGVAQVDIAQGATAQDLLNFLSVVSRAPEDVRAQGGINDVIAEMGVYTVTLTDVQLVTLDQTAASALDSEDMLLEIADSPAKLGRWFSAVSSDKEGLRRSLGEFVNVAGEDGTENLADALSGTLVSQPADNRDALLSLALEPGPARQLASKMFSMMDSNDIATAILDGKFGRNMLALSSALANLPFDDVADSVRREVLEMLPGTGHGPNEAEFLSHMLEVRGGGISEPSLVETDRTFKTIVTAGSVSEADIARAREVTTAATSVLDDVGIRTMLTLLDQQTDLERYCSGMEGIARMVPKLIERKRFDLVGQVFEELGARQSRHPEWPELGARLQMALAGALTAEAAAALVHACVEDRSLLPVAHDILRYGGESVQPVIAAEGVALKADGLEVASELLGKRLIDLLYGLVNTAQWFQLGPIVERLIADGSPRSLATVESLLTRPEEQARREVVNTLAGLGNPAVTPLLGAALRDPAEEVAAAAARGLAKGGVPGSAALIGARLGEIDMDNADFGLARELIGALARSPEPAADEALNRIASRRALIKRGHFADVQQLVAQAITVRQRGGSS